MEKLFTLIREKQLNTTCLQDFQVWKVMPCLWNQSFENLEVFDNSMFIVTFMNQYIDCIKANYICAEDVLRKDASEIKAFIELLCLAAQYKAGWLNIEDLWDTDTFNIEMYRLTMSLKRFRFIFPTNRTRNKKYFNELC